MKREMERGREGERWRDECGDEACLSGGSCMYIRLMHSEVTALPLGLESFCLSEEVRVNLTHTHTHTKNTQRQIHTDKYKYTPNGSSTLTRV